MPSRARIWALDIINCIDEIEEFLGDRKIFNEFKSNVLVKKAIERNLEIIGEAVKRIENSSEDYSIKNAHRVISTRNKLTHEYDRISNEIIWAIVVKELPVLKNEIIESFKL